MDPDPTPSSSMEQPFFPVSLFNTAFTGKRKAVTSLMSLP